MEQLWSPWRSEYIGSAHSQNEGTCFLCDCAAEVGPSFASLVVGSFEHCIVLLNRYPYNAGHLLIAPRVHTGDLATLDPVIATSIMDVLQRSIAITQKVLQPHGMDVGANLGRYAGAGVPDHLHFHIVPRWSGDTNFMPVLAETKVVSSELRTTWEAFSNAFAEAERP